MNNDDTAQPPVRLPEHEIERLAALRAEHHLTERISQVGLADLNTPWSTPRHVLWLPWRPTRRAT